MTFGDRVVGALKLDPNAFEDAERDPTSIGQAIGVILLGAISVGIGNIYWGGFSGIISGAVTSLIGMVVTSAIIWLVGTKLMPEPTTKADFPETLRVLGFASAPYLLGVITIIPILGWLLLFLVWLWYLAALVVAVRAVLDYSTIGKAVVVVLIAWVIGLVLSFLIIAPLIGARMMMAS